MKYIFGIFIVCSILLGMREITFAQKTRPVADEPSTKLGNFAATRGELIIKEFQKSGSYHGKYDGAAEFEAMTIYSPGREASKIQGLRVTISEGASKENTSFLDIDEAQSLDKAISYLSEVAAKWQNIDKPYTECNFRTKDNFELGFYQQGTKQVAYMQSGSYGHTNCFFESVSDLKVVQNNVNEALAKLGK